MKIAAHRIETRVSTASKITREAREVRKLQIVEDELERAGADEIRREAAKVLAQMVRSGELKASDVLDISDADVVELDG